MRIISLDATSWKAVSDFYTALFDALGASQKHGRNPNALLDVLLWYPDLNEVQPPYTIRILGTAGLSKDVRDEIATVGRVLTHEDAETVGVRLETDLQAGRV